MAQPLPGRLVLSFLKKKKENDEMANGYSMS